jgi:hypothetical protein
MQMRTGRDERVRVEEFDESVEYTYRLMTETD